MKIPIKNDIQNNWHKSFGMGEDTLEIKCVGSTGWHLAQTKYLTFPYLKYVT